MNNSELMNKYGINKSIYNNLRKIFKYKCSCCGIHEDELNKSLSVDHCHDTGEVRGLLCTNCNAGIGMLGDTRKGLLNALLYFDQYEHPDEYFTAHEAKLLRRYQKHGRNKDKRLAKYKPKAEERRKQWIEDNLK